MEILDTVKEHSVTDYDFIFHSGNKLALVIDHDAGDKVEETSDGFILHIMARPTSEAETVRVFKTHLAFLSTCHRKQRQATAEEEFNMAQFLKTTTSKTVQ